MGSKAATTLIGNIRENLNEPLNAGRLTDPNAGTKWTNNALLEHLNKGKDRTWDLIRSVREDYFLVTGNTSIALVSNTKEYTLPNRFWQLRGLRVTTSGYEGIKFRYADMQEEEFKALDAQAQGADNDFSEGELLYDIVAQSVLKLANFPPRSLSTSLDYIETLADYTLSSTSTSNIPDVWAEYMEAVATRLALERDPKDERIAIWRNKLVELRPLVVQSVSKRQLRDAEYVEPYHPV